MQCRLQHKPPHPNTHTHTHAHTPPPPLQCGSVMLSCSRQWRYISPAGCAAALQRATAYKTVNNWRHCFRGMHQLAPGLRGKGRRRRRGRREAGWFIVCWCRTEWYFGVETLREGERIGPSNGAKIPPRHGRWLSGASASTLWVGGDVWQQRRS